MRGMASTRQAARQSSNQPANRPAQRPTHRPATLADEQALYQAAPSFADMLPWVEYLPESECMLLDDGRSVAAFFELLPVGTEGREAAWLTQTRDALENALQDSFDELDEHPWVVQLYAQDDASFADYLATLQGYIQPRARDTAFSEHYLNFFARHVQAIAKPGGLFQDNAVTRLPWRGQTRRVRMVVYRRVPGGQAARRGQSPEQALAIICERLTGGLTNAGVQALRMNESQIHTWLLRWFNPQPTLLGDSAADREQFYRLAGAVGGMWVRILVRVWTRLNRTIPSACRMHWHWPTALISVNACSSVSRAPTPTTAAGTLTACRIGS